MQIKYVEQINAQIQQYRILWKYKHFWKKLIESLKFDNILYRDSGDILLTMYNYRIKEG